MSARLASTGNYLACNAPSAWGVLFVLPACHEDSNDLAHREGQGDHGIWANIRLGHQTHIGRAGGRHRRRR